MKDESGEIASTYLHSVFDRPDWLAGTVVELPEVKKPGRANKLRGGISTSFARTVPSFGEPVPFVERLLDAFTYGEGTMSEKHPHDDTDLGSPDDEESGEPES